MIIFVDLEHERLYQGKEDPGSQHCLGPQTAQACAAATLEIKYRLEDLAHEPCLIIRYNHVSLDLVRELEPRAVFVGGNFTEFLHYTEEDLAGLRALFREVPCPILGVCGAQQLMGQTYGSEMGSMGPVSCALADPWVGTPGQGRKQERGFLPVRLNQPHPLIEGLGDTATVLELHSWEVKSLPDGFQNLGESDACRLQILAHQELPLFGTVFHPERYDDEHPAGKRILANFMRIAGIEANI